MYPDTTQHDRRSHRGRNAVILWIFGAAISGAAIIIGVSVLAPAPQALRIAINPWPGYEFAALAEELGYYEDEGVNVRLIELSSLGDSRRAFERGRTDGLFGTSIEMMQARKASGREAVPVMVANFSDGADVVLARTPIAGVSELAGKRIGVESGTLGMYVLLRSLESAGIAWGDVEIVHVPYTAQREAFESGLIDAVVTFPPVSTELLEAGLGEVVFSSRDIPGEVVDLLAFDAEVLAERRSEVDAVLRAYFRAVEYLHSHPRDALRLMGERTGMDPAEIAALLDGDIRLVGQDEQGEYLGAGGSLERIMERTAEILRAPIAAHHDQLSATTPPGVERDAPQDPVAEPVAEVMTGD